MSLNVNDIDYTKLSTQELEELRDGAQAELYRRVHHYAGDGCVTHDDGDTFVTEASPGTPIGELSDGDVYEDDGRWYRIDDIQRVTTVAGVAYHVARTMVDD